MSCRALSRRHWIVHLFLRLRIETKSHAVTRMIASSNPRANLWQMKIESRLCIATLFSTAGENQLGSSPARATSNLSKYFISGSRVDLSLPTLFMIGELNAVEYGGILLT